MERLKENLIIYTIGAIGYGIMEVLFRGYTHWSMLIAGGLSFLSIYLYNKKYNSQSIILKCLFGTFVITSIEFVFGVVLNLIFKLSVWDYSSLSFNLLGQISLLFSTIWFFITIPIVFLCNFILKGFKYLNSYTAVQEQKSR